MGATTSVLLANWPDDGWSSSWGLSNSPRPGGMARVYEIQIPQAWGNASALVDGMKFSYNGVGDETVMRWTGTTKLKLSLTLPFMLWDHFSDHVTLQNLFIEWGTFAIPDFPFVCQWASQHNIPIPPSREVFSYPTPADCPCGIFHPGGPGQAGVTIRPLNENALAIWS